MGLAGHLANRGGRYLFGAAVVPPNLCGSRSWRVCRLATSSLALHDDKGGKEELKHTIILSQNGRHIQELPVIVRQAKLTPALWGEDASHSDDDKSTLVDVPPTEEELDRLRDVLKGCRTLKHLLELIWEMPSNEVSPIVFVEMLRKLIELENNQHYRRKTPPNNGYEDKDKESTHTRDAAVCSLLETIVKRGNPRHILESIKIITRDMTRAATRNNNSWVGYYRARLSHEALILATDSRYSITELCEIVHAFSYIYKEDYELIDMLWVGFEAKAGDIDATNIVDVFRTLPFFRKSRKVVFADVEYSFLQVCWSLSGAAIAEIMATLQTCKEVGFSALYWLRNKL